MTRLLAGVTLAAAAGAAAELGRRLEEMTLSAANEAGAFVIPVGLAFQEAGRQGLSIRLQMDCDDYHPTWKIAYETARKFYGR